MAHDTVMDGYGFRAFRVGLAMALAGLVAWLCTILTGHILLAIAAAAFGAIGAVILMFGVLEGRRRELRHHGS